LVDLYFGPNAPLVLKTTGSRRSRARDGLRCSVCTARSNQRSTARGSSITSSRRTDAIVRFWHKADMLNALTNVRFWGQNGR